MLIRRFMMEAYIYDPLDDRIGLFASGKTRLPWGHGKLSIIESSSGDCAVLYDNMILPFIERKRIFKDIGEEPAWVRISGILSVFGSDPGEIPEISRKELTGERHKPFFSYVIDPVLVEFLTNAQLDQATDKG